MYDQLNSEIWNWFGSEFKAYCANSQDYRKLMSWKGVRHGSTYMFSDGTVRHDVIFPYELFNRVAETLGLPERVPRCAKRQFAHS